MTDTAQIILAVGAAACLMLFPMTGLVWAFRSNPEGANYRFPSMLGLAPVAGLVIYALGHLLS